MGLACTILRRSFFTAAAVSTLLLLATLVLWPVSYHRAIEARYVFTGQASYSLGCDWGRWGGHYSEHGSLDRGGLTVGAWEIQPREVISWTYLTWNSPGTPEQIGGTDSSESLGVWWFNDRSPGPAFRGVAIPFSYLALLFAILPLLAFRALRRRRRAQRIGLCPRCGYDLRAQHAGSGGAVCPECGRPVGSHR